MKNIILYIGVVVGLAIFASCQKTPEYIKVPYMCNCGSIGWDGTTYEVLGAEFVFNPDTLSRKYFVTSEISADSDPEVHHINFELEIEDILTTFYNIEDAPLSMSFKEVDYNSALVYKTFEAVSGTVELFPAPFGGPEKVIFSFVVRQTIDGSLFGPEIPYNGSFNLDVEL